jgi:Flp pilus assembly protein TadG
MMVLYAVLLPVLILFTGLSVDIGLLEMKRVQMQTAADAAAIAAELEEERGTQNWLSMGQQDAALNGFTDGQSGTTVAIQQTSFGPYAPYYNAFNVTITQTEHTIFMGLVSGGQQTLTARATSVVPPCLAFLGLKGASTTLQAASANMVSTCPISVNGPLIVDGFSNMYGWGINVAATSANISGHTSQGYNGWTTGPPTLNQPAVVDPLAWMAQPSYTSCSSTSMNIASGDTVTLSPGTYCGTSSTPGLTANGATITLLPGLYVFTGGMSITNGTFSGMGVTLYFTSGNGAADGQVNFTDTGSSSCTVNLAAPTSTSGGGVPGVLFWADRNWVKTNTADFSLNTNVSFTGDGIWYLPGTGVYVWQVAMSIPNYGGIVADNMYFYNSTFNFKGNFSSIPGGSPFRTQSVLVQ